MAQNCIKAVLEIKRRYVTGKFNKTVELKKRRSGKWSPVKPYY